ncbi:MAG: hypothetical protein KJO36_04630 [Acidimicrobiia bacterium]|nr:hypothetical protein [Acidimicrobiia bacterium]
MTEHNGHQGSRAGTLLKDLTGRFKTSEATPAQTPSESTDATTDRKRGSMAKKLIGLAVAAIAVALLVRILGGKS